MWQSATYELARNRRPDWPDNPWGEGCSSSGVNRLPLLELAVVGYPRPISRSQSASEVIRR
jgi:hypothetical protein